MIFTIKQMTELRQVKSRAVQEKTDIVIKSVLSQTVDLELVKELQVDIRVLNAEINLLELVMGLKN